jgi:general secretion pathway protein G
MHSYRKAFTLVELVVVILILGILAAVAAPRMFDTAGRARDNGTRQSLAVVRSAIELYRAEEGELPAGATLAADLGPYLNGPFPSVQSGANQNADIGVVTESPIATPAGETGWLYNETTGEFCVNEAPFITTW